MNAQKYSLDTIKSTLEGKSLLQIVPYSTAKEIALALRRTVRRSKYLDQGLMKHYINGVVDKKFPDRPNISHEDFVNDPILMEKYTTIRDGMQNEQRENFEEADGRLKGTMRRGGNTWDHMRIAKRETKKYMHIDQRKGFLTEEDHELVDITKAIHDIAEWIFGDLISYQKREDDKRMEYVIGKIIVERLAKEMNVEEEVRPEIKSYLDHAREIAFAKDNLHPIQQSEQTKNLSRYFRLNEVYDFYLDAIYVCQNPQHIKDAGDSPEMEQYNAGALVHSVISYQIPEITQYIKVLRKEGILYPSIKAFLREQESAIDEMFAFVQDSHFLEKSSPKDTITSREKQHRYNKAKIIREKNLKKFIHPKSGKKSTNHLPVSTVEK